MQEILEFFSYENLIGFTEFMREIGPIGGVLLIMLEGILTFLPQSLFVALNVYFYGFWVGSLASYTGTVIISILTYFIFSKIANTKFVSKWLERPNIKKVSNWLKKNRFIFLTIYFSTPITSASAMCMACGLAKVEFKKFILPMLIGKIMLITSISLIGKNMMSFLENPILSTSIIIIIFVIYFIASKFVEEKESQ